MKEYLQSPLRIISVLAECWRRQAFPVDKAAKTAVQTVKRFLEEYPNEIDMVEWVLFDDRTWGVYESEIGG